jgi:hypothetical protein
MAHIYGIMNAINFVSAYKQLSSYEREFVDDFLHSLDREAERRFERLTITLERVSASLSTAQLDDRTRDLLRKPIVIAAIRERVEEIANGRDLTPQRVIREHAAIALANINRFFVTGEDGSVTFDATNCNDIDWAAVASIDIDETYGPRGAKRTYKIKMHNKQVSLDALAKFMGLDKGDNPEYAAYKTLPADISQLPNSASVSELAEDYAKFIDG